ncbi:hypothetical protein ETAA8_09750 [Anatilimnocola aggregata]|uniref:Carboxypeptidase regulatory-like domain-containing protein n=1 Tax=Anatilimnocola aggregata TaxID=2528021 RepID=A0A517Y6N9_9BACT|nr:hypothetical protein [Anatilimnocola aggregata]QDU25903.1 hypothetical protein ETAA8_09750 [Anatilimnocola aggregata]
MLSAGRNSLCCSLAFSALALGSWPLFFAAGCSEPGEALLDVRGTVQLEQEPLTTGVVSLRAENGNETRHQPTGLIDSQGNYRLYTAGRPGAPPGFYRVVVFANEPAIDLSKVHPGLPKSLIPKRYNDAISSPLAFEVKPDAAAGSYNLQLTRAAP